MIATLHTLTPPPESTDIELETGGACPVQGFGTYGGCPVYIRSRGSQATLQVGAPGTDPLDEETQRLSVRVALPDSLPRFGWLHPDELDRWARAILAAWSTGDESAILAAARTLDIGRQQ